jgi:hypothetical protein
VAGKGHNLKPGDTDAKVMLAEAFYRRDDFQTDPLPVVSVRVNGGDEVTFFIDTGSSEVCCHLTGAAVMAKRDCSAELRLIGPRFGLML